MFGFSQKSVATPPRYRRENFTPDRLFSSTSALVNPVTAYLEAEFNEQHEIVDIYEIQEFEDGSSGSFKYGISLSATNEITVSGNGAPMWPEGEPVDDVVEQTLMIISIYLRES